MITNSLNPFKKNKGGQSQARNQAFPNPDGQGPKQPKAIQPGSLVLSEQPQVPVERPQAPDYALSHALEEGREGQVASRSTYQLAKT